MPILNHFLFSGNLVLFPVLHFAIYAAKQRNGNLCLVTDDQACPFIPPTLISINLSAQTPPPPNGGNDPGDGNTPVGGGAPIAGGAGILLALGAAYGGKKVYDVRKKQLAD